MRVSLVGIEILKIDARIVVASVDTYLRFAEACNRLDLENDTSSRTVPELFGGGMAKSVGKAGAKKAAHSVGDKVKKAVGIGEDDEDEQEEERPRRSRTSRSRSTESERPRRHKEDRRPMTVSGIYVYGIVGSSHPLPPGAGGVGVLA